MKLESCYMETLPTTCPFHRPPILQFMLTSFTLYSSSNQQLLSHKKIGGSNMPDQSTLKRKQASTSEEQQREPPEQSTSTTKKREAPEPSTLMGKEQQAPAEEGRGRERLKRHRREMAGSICIPDTWGKESMLKDWTGFPSVVESSLVPEGISFARRALVVACRHPE